MKIVIINGSARKGSGHDSFCNTCILVGNVGIVKAYN